MKSAPATPYCRAGARHWFAYYGLVGSSAPTCQRCGAANPNYDPERDDKANDPFWRARAESTTDHTTSPKEGTGNERAHDEDSSTAGTR